MKKLIILLLFPFFTIFSQPINNHVGQVGLPTPEAAAIGKFGDVPVDYFTGLTANTIPLHTIKAGPIQLNISLSHHFGGLKVAEIPSWVGLGWALQYGGLISRTIQGIEDELAGGYYWQGTSTTDNGTCISNPNYAQPTNAMANGQLDGEPDLFSYNVGGFSGKFYINAAHQVIKIPENDLKIEYSIGNGLSDVYNLSQFVITLPDGAKYYYGTNTTATKAIEITRLNQSSFWSASTWKLMKISSADDKYSIDLTYSNEAYSFGVRNQRSGFFSAGENSYDKIEVLGNRISFITSSTGRDILNFVPKQTVREDLFPQIASPSTAYALDRLEINQGNYCKKFLFNSSYSTDNTSNATGLANENKKRLILNSVQEKSCDDAISIPAYTFEYDIAGSYLPHKTSAAIDHWGFFNGAETNKAFTYNIPTTVLEYTLDNSIVVAIEGGANRNAQYASSKLGALTKIIYPTGGYRSFEYESNQVYDTLSTTTKTYLAPVANLSSCSNDPFLYDEFTTSLTNVNNTYYELNINGLTGSFCCPENTSKYVNFFILQGTTIVSTITTYLNCEQSNIIRGKLPSNLQNNVNYTFRVNPYYASGNLKLFVMPTSVSYTNIDVGGIRIKKITHHDGISTANNIIKNYEYENNSIPGRSSGVLYNKPKYGFIKTFDNSCNFGDEESPFTTHFFFDTPPIPLASFEGYTIGYQTVKESTAGAGYRKFNYFAPTIAPINSLPFGPPQPSIIAGKVESESDHLPNNSTIAYAYNTPKGDAYTNNTNELIKCFWAASAGGSGSPVGIVKNYEIGTKPYRLLSVENHKDGLSTNTSLAYRTDKEHLLPIQTETTHPDGTVEKQLIKYAKDLNETNLLSRNMIHIPLEKTTFTNNVATGGEKTNYSLFSSFPRPQTVQSYNTQLAAWETEATFSSFDTFGNPSSVTYRGWQPETYTWDKDLLTQKKFLTFQWDYLYKSNTSLVDRFTEPNGLFTSYDYDGLSRLDSINKYSGKSITTLSYAYATANNRITSSTDNATGADLATEKTMDGLGRNIKIREIGYGHDSLDVVTKIDYDLAGRVKKEYLPGFNSPGVATEYTYENSPLGRISTVTKPAPLGIENFVYGNENIAFTQTVTNSLNEYSKTITDTRGRKISAIMGNASLTNTTNYQYDDRDNLLKVIPDGRTATNTDYIYNYTYNGRNLLLSKKLPEKALMEMRYNLRDLPSHQKDGINPVVYTEFDDYGRETKSSTTTSLTSTNIINVLSEMEYKTTAGLGFGQAFKTKLALFGANGLPNGQFIQSETTGFDAYHRPTDFISNHILNIANLSSISSSIVYNALDQATSQTETINVAGVPYITSQTYSYDNGGRQIKTEQSFAGTTKTIDEITAFDALDNPLTNLIGGNLQTVNYSYLPSGFLDKINGGSTGAGGIGLISNAVPNINSNADLFAMELGYTANGNINQWKLQNRGFSLQTNTYQYDGLFRLTSANNGTQAQSFTYKDALGNIQTINRTDLVKENGNWTSKTIDNLTYSYTNSLSNKITSIADASNNPMGYKPNSGSYAFDGNGNRTADPANSTTAMHNYLNLPSKFTKPDNSKLEIIYDASGQKWQEIGYGTANNLISQKSYIGSMELEGNSLALVHHGNGFIKNMLAPQNLSGAATGTIQGLNISSTQAINEGLYEAEQYIDLWPGFEALPADKVTAQINPIASNYQWQYAINDHLGNLRVLFTDKNNDGLIKQSSDEADNEVLSIRNYSPFGLELGGSHQNMGTQNSYKFGGKEENGFSGYSDFGGRWLDKSAAGWTSQDLLGELSIENSTYSAMDNDPISMIDPSGLAAGSSNGELVGADNYTNQEWLDKDKPKEWYQKAKNFVMSDAPAYNEMSSFRQKINDFANSSFVTNVNEWNPYYHASNAASGFLTGKSIYGKTMSGGDVAMASLTILPVGKIAGPVVKKVLRKVALAKSKATGKAMETALGMSASKTGIKVAGKMRFPDRLSNGFLEEAKNVKHLNLTSQLKDYLTFSKSNSIDFILYTRQATTFSKPLEKLIKSKVIIHKIVPGF